MNEYPKRLRHRCRKGLLAWVLVAFLLSFHTFACAQDLNKKISLNISHKSLESALREISNKGGIPFSYSNQALPLQQKVSLHTEGSTVREALSLLLDPLHIQAIFTGGFLVLKPAIQAAEIPLSNPKRYTLSGYVTDSASGQAIPGAYLFDALHRNGTTTNAYGFFSFSAISGAYQLKAGMLGYQTLDLNLLLDADRQINIELSPQVQAISPIVVSDMHQTSPGPVQTDGHLSLEAPLLKKMPVFAGNFDVIKTLTSMPGFNSFGDGSGFFYVRGGNNDQNLLLIDDAPIYNPSHLFGFFSALAPGAVNQVKAFRGEFPANYGGRLSSVVDIRAREGNLRQFGLSANLGPFTSDFTIEGPLVRDKSSFLVSSRFSNLQWLVNSNPVSQGLKVRFSDINAKFNFSLNRNNRLFVTFFRGADILSRRAGDDSSTFGISWKNLAAVIRWNHVFGPRLFSNTTLSSSQYEYLLYTSIESDQYWQSQILHRMLKTDFSWFQSQNSIFRAGVEFGNPRSVPGYVNQGSNQSTKPPEVGNYQSFSATAYLLHDLTWKRWNLNYGLRLNSWRDYGPATVYFFDPNHSVIDTVNVSGKTVYSQFRKAEPRLRLQYRFTDKALAYSSYNRSAQFIFMLSNSESPFTSLEVWAPAGPNLPPQVADQYAAGWQQEFTAMPLLINAEVYYRKLYGQIDYKDHANMLYNPLLEGELRTGNTRTYGLEVLLQKNKGKFTGWLSYAFSNVVRQSPEVNSGKGYAPYYDRPHSVRVVASYQIRPNLKASMMWLYQTGAPTSTPLYFYRSGNYMVPVYGDKNNSRLPDYHRLDANIAWQINPSGKLRHSLVLSAYNVYARHNPFAYNFNKIIGDDGQLVVPTDVSGNYQVIPTQLSVAGIIPSLNYQFNF